MQPVAVLGSKVFGALSRPWSLSEHQEAYDLAREAIDVQRRHNPEHTDMAEILSVTAMICRMGLQCYDEAHRYYDEAEAILAEALAAMPVKLRRLVLLAYLGFPFYDVATLSVRRNEELTEFEPVKVDLAMMLSEMFQARAALKM